MANSPTSNNKSHLPPDSIIDRSWSNLIQDIFSDGIICYRIDFSRVAKRKHLYSRESRFVHKFLYYTDTLTGLSSNHVADKTKRPNLVISFSPLRDFQGIRGITVARRGRISIEIYHSSSGYIIQNFKQVISHELLHALGLSHPFGDGAYPSASTSDTLMSYNDFDRRYNQITDLDILALSYIWD